MPSLDEIRKQLIELGQAHLFADPKTPNLEQEASLLEQVKAFGDEYPGGVSAYISKARTLLKRSQEGRSSLDGCVLAAPPLVFNAPPLFESTSETEGAPSWAELESEGLSLVKKTAFVLVAGGLGERLGYSSIKVGLPVETATKRTYLEHYLSWLRQVAGEDQPFVMMTSADTDSRTRELLEKNEYFGMKNVSLLLQGLVPCLGDGEAALVSKVDAETGKLSLMRKPHGHGDVHTLLHNSGLLEKWAAIGIENVVFMQDTNAAATATVPISLAISRRENLAMNLTCVPRLPGEAVGCLCRLTKPGSSEPDADRVGNVEYNLVGPALQATTGKGDEAAPGSRFSAFPGSINTLVLSLAPYAASMQKTQGLVPEFVNPKYADATKTVFKSPTRLETLMQDVAYTLGSGSRVGGTVFERRLYSPVKNSLAEAVVKVKSGLDGHTACTGEAAVLLHQRMRFEKLGPSKVDLKTPDETAAVFVNGVIPVELFPIVVFVPSFAVGQASLAERVQGKARISANSAVIVSGDVTIKDLDVDGSVRFVAGEGVRLVVDGLKVKNKGWDVELIDESAAGVTELGEVNLIRGYVLQKNHTLDVIVDAPGDYVVSSTDKEELVVTTATKAKI